MSSIDDPEDLLHSLRPLPQKSDAGRPVDAAEAVIAALDDADIALEAEDDVVTLLPDSGADAIEILEAEPIPSDEAHLAGAVDPVDLFSRRAKNERPKDRIGLLERQLEDEKDERRAAVLQHEIAVLLEQAGSGIEEEDIDAAQGYAAALTRDPALRPNLWALRRLYYRRGMWPSLIRLLDLEADAAASARERAELLTEKGHILEDRLGSADEAMVCYRSAHEMDREALAPIVALEKVLTRQAGESTLAQGTTRPGDELLAVYRALLHATKDPGRRVALLIEQARIEELPQTSSGDNRAVSTDVTSALNCLHDAYDVGVDQLRVIDEIVRITATAGRIPDCLTALDIRAEILEMQVENAQQPRKQFLTDQIVGIRRWQALLAREKVGNLDLAWQYLEQAQEKSPADPLLLPELLTVADAQGHPARLYAQLMERERELRIQRSDDAPPPIGLWLKQAMTLRAAGSNDEAEKLESQVAGLAPTHLLLPLLRQRRAMERFDLPALAALLEAEASRVSDGISGKNGDKTPDVGWACEALIAAADCILQSGDLARAEALATQAESLLTRPLSGPGRTHRALLDALLEEIYLRSSREGLLAQLFERRLSDGMVDQSEAHLLREVLADLYTGVLSTPDAAKPHLAELEKHAATDLRLLRRRVLQARFRGDLADEERALGAWIGALGDKAVPTVSDFLRRGELLTKLGRGQEAIALYEHVLSVRPGHLQALEELERLYLSQGRKDELSQLLRRQMDQIATQTDDASLRAERGLYAKLIDFLENELNLPDQAASLHRAVLQRDPTNLSALFALRQHYRRSADTTKFQATLSQIAEHAPTEVLRGEMLLEVADLRDDQAAKPLEVDALYDQALQASPLPSMAATHAAVGRLKATMQQRRYERLGEIFEGLSDSLSPDDPLSLETCALLAEEKSNQLLLSEIPTSSELEQADAKLQKTAKELRDAQDKVSAAAKLQLGLTRVLLNQRREDGKAQGDALAEWAELLLAQNDAACKPLAGELLVRAGLLTLACDDDPGCDGEAARRFLLAYRVLGDEPQVVIPLTDLLSDLSVLEQVAQLPDVVRALRARQSLCADGESLDRVQFVLLEVEALLIQSSADEVDEPTAAKLRQSAAEAALRALQIHPNHLHALFLLRQSTAPTTAELDPLRDQPLSPESAARLRAYAMYTLRMAAVVTDGESRADLYVEAGQMLLRLGDQDGAAASLRAAVDSRPFDENLVSTLLGLLKGHADQTGDNGPLLELLDFRLAQVPRSDGDSASDQAMRVQLLSQRAALHLLSGQNLLAAADLETLLSIKPDHTLSHHRLAALRSQHGDIAAATMHYERLLELAHTPSEKYVLHRTLGELLPDHAPDKAIEHLTEALKLRHTLRQATGTEETLEDTEQRVQLQRRLFGLFLRQGDKPNAYKTLKAMASELPTSNESATLREKTLLDVAKLYEFDVGDPVAAALVLERLIDEKPLQIEALEHFVKLCQTGGDAAKAQQALLRARDAARAEAAKFADIDVALSGKPFEALKQILNWQKSSEAHSLAAQAFAQVSRAVGGLAESASGLLLRVPDRSVGPPLRSAAFSSEARGLPFEIWQEVWETASKLLGPDVAQLSSSPKDRINAKKIPPAWVAVDSFAQRFGLGNTDLSIAYVLVAGKEKETCAAVGQQLVCGSAYTEPLAAWTPAQSFRLVQKLALIPDRLGAVDCAPTEILLFFASCCQLVGKSGPALAQTERTKLDEKTRNLDRAITRKERSKLKDLSSKMQDLAGEHGKELLLGWQRSILQGCAHLALAMTGHLAAAFSETGFRLDADEEHSLKAARNLLAWSVSADILNFRRELGLTDKE